MGDSMQNLNISCRMNYSFPYCFLGYLFIFLVFLYFSFVSLVIIVGILLVLLIRDLFVFSISFIGIFVLSMDPPHFISLLLSIPWKAYSI